MGDGMVKNVNTNKLVGIVGNIGEGKDTIADYLVNQHNFKRESFAGTLKDAVSAVFGWDRTLLEGQTTESREWREQVDQWWADKLNIPNLTPRYVLQQWGTEVCRRSFHDAIWVASLENKLRNITTNVVISDCRFPNEFAAIKNAGGIIVRVKRGPDPEWHTHAQGALAGKIEDILILKEFGIHESEWAWYGLTVDYTIDNNSTLDALYAKITEIIKI
jgi:hypothetical protein